MADRHVTVGARLQSIQRSKLFLRWHINDTDELGRNARLAVYDGVMRLLAASGALGVFCVVLRGLALGADFEITERSFVYNGGAFGPVSATKVSPIDRNAKSPGILWVHWLGEPATTNKTEFLAEARVLARRGATSLLVDAMWSRPDWFSKGRAPRTDERDLLAQVGALRIGLDELASDPSVDRTALTLVGHDYGAMYGGLAAADDARVRNLVLIAPSLTIWDWFLFGAPPSDVPAYVTSMAKYDLVRRLPKSHATAVLGQFADSDQFVPVSNAWTFKSIFLGRDVLTKRYPTDHALAIPEAVADRDGWLLSHLSLGSP